MDFAKIKVQDKTNRFRLVGNYAVVKPLNSESEFILDSDDWDRLPWSCWVLANGYPTCHGIGLHRLVAYLNGLYDEDPNAVIDHKNRNPLDNRKFNLRACNSIQNGWNSEKRHGHQLKNGKWKFTFSKSFPTMADAEQELAMGRFQYMSKNRTCFTECTFDTYDEGMEWWRFNAGIHYGEFSPFANPYQTVEEILLKTSQQTSEPHQSDDWHPQV